MNFLEGQSKSRVSLFCFRCQAAFRDDFANCQKVNILRQNVEMSSIRKEERQDFGPFAKKFSRDNKNRIDQTEKAASLNEHPVKKGVYVESN